MERKRNVIWKVIFVVAMVLIILGLAFICVYLYKLYTGGNEYDDFKTIISSTNPQVTNSSMTNSSRTEASTMYGDTEDAPLDNVAPEAVFDRVNGGINFTELQKINTDLYAWIRIPNTMIDYPVAQYPGDDNEYYLSHNMYKESAFAGCIYTEKANNKDFSDPNTVLYGHNMLNGSMFRALHSFRDKAFFDENPYIYIYLPERTLTYEIFVAYEYDNRHLLNSFDFKNKEVFKEYLDYAQNPTHSMMSNTRQLNVTTDDKIITLSTCLGDYDTSRYLVQGVLIKDEPVQQ